MEQHEHALAEVAQQVHALNQLSEVEQQADACTGTVGLSDEDDVGLQTHAQDQLAKVDAVDERLDEENTRVDQKDKRLTDVDE